MKAILFLAILVVLSSCASPINPWPEDPTIPPTLELIAPQTVLVHEPFRIQAITSSNSRSPKQISLNWKWIEGEDRYPASDNIVVREGLQSLESVSFYASNGQKYDALISLEISGINSRSDLLNPIPYTLNIDFNPPLPRTEDLANVESLFGKTNYIGNINGELIFMSFNNHRTYEIPNPFSIWSKGNLINGEIIGYKKEVINTICSEQNQATIVINSEARRVVEGRTYSYSDSNIVIPYTITQITYTTIPVETGTILLQFDDGGDGLSLGLEIGQPQSIFVSGTELAVTLLGVSCIPQEQNIIPAEISFNVDSEITTLKVGEIIKSTNGDILVKDFYHYEFPLPGAAVYLAFNPEKIVANSEGLFRGLPNSMDWTYNPISSEAQIFESNSAITGLRIVYPPSSELKDHVFGAFYAFQDRTSGEIVVKDTSTIQILEEGNNFVAYFTQKGTYNFEVTATEDGVSTRKMITINVV